MQAALGIALQLAAAGTRLLLGVERVSVEFERENLRTEHRLFSGTGHEPDDQLRGFRLELLEAQRILHRGRRARRGSRHAHRFELQILPRFDPDRFARRHPLARAGPLARPQADPDRRGEREQRAEVDGPAHDAPTRARRREGHLPPSAFSAAAHSSALGEITCGSSAAGTSSVR